VTRLAWGLVAALAFVLAVNVLQGRDAEAYNRAERERLAAETRIWQAKYAESETRAARAVDTVRVRVDRVRTLRDTLRLTDTVMVREYVERADSALRACSELADSCSQFRQDAAALIQSQRTQIEWWVRHDKPHHSLRTKLRERVGLYVGYGITSAGGQVSIGPQLGFGLRLVP
jgi:hypothetical protein